MNPELYEDLYSRENIGKDSPKYMEVFCLSNIPKATLLYWRKRRNKLLSGNPAEIQTAYIQSVNVLGKHDTEQSGL